MMSHLDDDMIGSILLELVINHYDWMMSYYAVLMIDDFYQSLLCILDMIVDDELLPVDHNLATMKS